MIGSIFAALLMLSMPMISNIQAQPAPATTPAEETDECSICPEGRDDRNWDFPFLCKSVCIALKVADRSVYLYEQGYEGLADMVFLVARIIAIPALIAEGVIPGFYPGDCTCD